MSANEPAGSTSAETGGDQVPDVEATSTRRQLKGIASDLWHQKPGPRAPRAPRPLPANVKEIVNGLDQRERMLGFVGSTLTIVSAIVSWAIDRHSSVLHTRQISGDLLVAGVVLGIVMLVGTLLRRRALLGFAAFMTGFELITGGNITGVVYLFFGGWLILRVMRRQRQETAAGRPAGTFDPKPDPRNRAPKPSKRYTPPRASSRRR